MPANRQPWRVEPHCPPLLIADDRNLPTLRVESPLPRVAWLHPPPNLSGSVARSAGPTDCSAKSRVEAQSKFPAGQSATAAARGPEAGDRAIPRFLGHSTRGARRSVANRPPASSLPAASRGNCSCRHVVAARQSPRFASSLLGFVGFAKEIAAYDETLETNLADHADIRRVDCSDRCHRGAHPRLWAERLAGCLLRRALEVRAG